MSTISKPEPAAESVIYQAIESLSLWPRNYRRGHVDQIARSISRFGFNDALRVWKGTVMAGNHTLLALRQLHESGSPIPQHVVEDPAGGWMVRCLDIGHLTQSEAEAFAIVDNRLSDIAENDEEALLALLNELSLEDSRLVEDAGFSVADVDALAGIDPSDPSPPAQSGGAGINATEQYGVIVMCADEAEQQEVYDRLTEDGLKCKVVCV